MRRILAMLLCLSFIASFSGCNNNKDHPVFQVQLERDDKEFILGYHFKLKNDVDTDELFAGIEDEIFRLVGEKDRKMYECDELEDIIKYVDGDLIEWVEAIFEVTWW